MKIFLALFIVSFSMLRAEGLWQSFVDFFDPASSKTPASGREKELQKIDEEIRQTKNDYNREHRPQRKSMLRKHLEELQAKRDSIASIPDTTSITLSSSSAILSSSSSVASSSSEKAESAPAITPSIGNRDTVWIIEKRVVHDTIFIHDTLYIEKISKEQKDSIP